MGKASTQLSSTAVPYNVVQTRKAKERVIAAKKEIYDLRKASAQQMRESKARLISAQEAASVQFHDETRSLIVAETNPSSLIDRKRLFRQQQRSMVEGSSAFNPSGDVSPSTNPVPFQGGGWHAAQSTAATRFRSGFRRDAMRTHGSSGVVSTEPLWG